MVADEKEPETVVLVVQAPQSPTRIATESSFHGAKPPQNPQRTQTRQQHQHEQHKDMAVSLHTKDDSGYYGGCEELPASKTPSSPKSTAANRAAAATAVAAAAADAAEEGAQIQTPPDCSDGGASDLGSGGEQTASAASSTSGASTDKENMSLAMHDKDGCSESSDNGDENTLGGKDDGDAVRLG